MPIESKYYSPMPKKKKSTKSTESKKVSSRLAQKEQKKLTQQTLITVVITVAILGLFVFVIMPGAIRLFFRLIDQGANFDPGDNVPPQVPVLNAPVSATHSASLKLTGFGEAKSDVVFVLNAEEIDRVQINDEGQFEYELDLDEGENALSLYSIDGSSNESNTTKTYQILMDNEAPTIEIEGPEDGAQIELKKNQQLTIKGITEAKAKVYVNGRISYADNEGNFKSSLLLNEGENKLEIRAEDKAGNSTQMELTVHFKF